MAHIDSDGLNLCMALETISIELIPKHQAYA